MQVQAVPGFMAGTEALMAALIDGRGLRLRGALALPAATLRQRKPARQVRAG